MVSKWKMPLALLSGFTPMIPREMKRSNKLKERWKCCLFWIANALLLHPPGLTDKEVDSYDAVGERFAKLLEIGIQQNVIPQLELWGFSKTLYKTSQLLYVAAQCGMPETRLLTDVYHLYKGGSNFDSLKLIASSAIEVFHMNDYLLAFDRKTITDADRIYPGSGDAPLTSIIKDLAKDREKVVLSLELFNPEYYKMEPKLVIEKGFGSNEKCGSPLFFFSFFVSYLFPFPPLIPSYRYLTFFSFCTLLPFNFYFLIFSPPISPFSYPPPLFMLFFSFFYFFPYFFFAIFSFYFFSFHFNLFFLSSFFYSINLFFSFFPPDLPSSNLDILFN